MNELLEQCEADITSRRAKVEQAIKIPKRFRADKHKRQKRRLPVAELGKGYDQLPDQQGWFATPEGFMWGAIPWATYYNVAVRFANKALADEREDLLHDILIGLARTGQLKASRGEQFTEIAQIRTAEHIKDHYWYKHYAYYNGLDCQHCSKEQRAKCRYNWGHSDWAFADCHRAVQLESLNQPITDSEGNITELAELIADDKALDLEAWLDAKTFLIGAPIRLKAIARKRSNGEALTATERKYLSRLREKEQMTLVNVTI